MFASFCLAILFLSPASAGSKEARTSARAAQADQEIDTEVSTDHTAYLVRPGQWRLGLATFDYGLTETLQLRTAPALLPMLIQGQDFIDAQDDLSVLEFMRKSAHCRGPRNDLGAIGIEL